MSWTKTTFDQSVLCLINSALRSFLPERPLWREVAVEIVGSWLVTMRTERLWRVRIFLSFKASLKAVFALAFFE